MDKEEIINASCLGQMPSRRVLQAYCKDCYLIQVSQNNFKSLV